MFYLSEPEDIISRRISQLRMAKGVSAREMSLSIGQGAAYINNIENKRIMPSMRGLFYVCEYLNISPRDFFDFDFDTGLDNNHSIDNNVHIEPDTADPEQLSNLIHDLEELPSDQVTHIACLVKCLKNNSSS